MKKSDRHRLSDEQLLKAVQKKKECNAKAQAVVESFLEKNIEKDYFLTQLNNINQCHYDDVVDERNILMLCGYPLCRKELENVPTKKYQISTTKNKVYDITDRKKFCSSTCFKASEFIKSQILVSPLWLRQCEIIPEFKLLDEKGD
ncbi:putative RNA polymerase II subunit B1 CTD phosphatase RPAP2 homolog [Anastrepha obliqua]|uniref:putative RNA polymerase II subunit B1 CTD phosphatase RPAP2 homolog n=1 Tax=Anastrepha obliqua TaxID=95512 RepID=UPI00240A8785|nr:putative RNA polymerase II subunit B1 CTD phosphatase RPAP2 homolog [Anastrepha obliqua]